MEQWQFFNRHCNWGENWIAYFLSQPNSVFTKPPVGIGQIELTLQQFLYIVSKFLLSIGHGEGGKAKK